MNIKQLKLLADIQTGPFGSQLHKEDYVGIGTPIVTVEHLGNRVFTEQNLPHVSDNDKARLGKYVLKQGDIVFSRVGSVDRCSYVDAVHDGWMFSGRCLRVRPNEQLDPMYLYYYFCMEETKQFVRNIAVGATMPSINTKLLGEVPITYPNISEQKCIAQILSALDDKIENNKKINDNLQHLLQHLDKPFQTGLVFLREAAHLGAVDIQHTPDPAVYTDRHHDLGIGSAVTGDMSGEFMDIINQLCLFLRHSGAANAPAHRNFNTGRLALERPQHKNSVFHFVKTGPVDLREILPKQCGSVG